MKKKFIVSSFFFLLIFTVTVSSENLAATSIFEAPTGTWRPFSNNSPWNMNIQNAPLQTAGTLHGFKTHNSATYIQFLDQVAVESTISTSKWSEPLYFVDSSTTAGVTVKFTNEQDYDPYFLDSMNPVPIPSNAVSDPGETGHYPPVMSDIIPDLDLADAELCIVDIATGFEYDFWHIAKDSNGNWRASAGAKLSINSDGVFTETDLLTTSYARGTAVPLLAGLILRNEVAAGEIRHALAMSIPDSRNRKNFYVWPGLITDGNSADSRALPEGTRLRLKWTLQEIENRYQTGQLTKTGRIIAIALRKYGAYNVDNGGDAHLTFYAQNFSDTFGAHNAEPGYWPGLLNMDAEGYAGDVDIIRPSDFEVIQFEYGKNVSAPDIKANGSDGPVTLAINDTLSFTVSLSAGENAGQNADWWIAINTSYGGWYYYNKSTGWQSALTVAYQGPLFDFSSFNVLNGISGLPPGAYIAYFGFDTIVDGAVSNPIYYDRVDIAVTN